MSVIKNIAAIVQGMGITFREMFQPTIVENYPDGPGVLKGAKFQERFRGMHVLQRDENGLEKCVACFLCAAACPSNCIYIEAAENTAENRVSGAERYAKVYNIDYNRCIFCGYCVEACPTDAITHGHGFELASLQRQQPDLPQGTVVVHCTGAYGSECRVWQSGYRCGRAGDVAAGKLTRFGFGILDYELRAGPRGPAFVYRSSRWSFVAGRSRILRRAGSEVRVTNNLLTTND